MIRLVCFRDRPDCMAMFAREGDPPANIGLTSPFTRSRVLEAAREAGVPVRVVEMAYVGRFRPVLDRLLKDEKAERAQQQHMREAMMLGATDPTERTRAELIQEKKNVDDELRKLKVKLGEAKSLAALRGQYMPPSEYRRLERRVADLKDRSLSMQNELGRLRDEQKQRNISANIGRERVFQKVAHDLLPKHLFDQVIQEMERRLSLDAEP